MKLEDVLPRLRKGAFITRRSYPKDACIGISSDGVIRWMSATNPVGNNIGECMDWDNDDILATDWEFVKERSICPCYEEGHSYMLTYDTCLGTKEKEPCTCRGNRNNCDFYKNKI